MSEDQGSVASELTRAKEICLRLLTVRARSRAELADKLAARDISADIAERALDRLEEVGLIDDAAFAELFAASQRRDRGLGRAGVRRELYRKGIDREIAAEVLGSIDDDSERERAAALVRSRLDSALLAGIEKGRRRLLALLARRGYSASVAALVVNDALRGFAEPLDGPNELTDDDPAAW